MDAVDFKIACQNVFRKNPVVIVGTGLSVSMKIPGMKELQAHLIESLPSIIKNGLLDEWQTCTESIKSHGLEAGLSKVQVSTELLTHIVNISADYINKFDATVRKEIFCSPTQSFPFSKLLAFLFKGLPPTTSAVNVITPNYDHLVEYACDIAKIECINGFSGYAVGTFNEGELKTDYYTPYIRAERQRSVRDFKMHQSIRLFKPHGSLHWQKLGDHVFQHSELFPESKRILITPGLTKFEHSLTDPVMNSIRESANQCLRNATAAIIIGYGFNDSHLQTVLNQRISEGMECLIITHTLSENAKALISKNNRLIGIEATGEKDKESLCYANDVSFTISEQLWDLKVFISNILGL